MRIIADDTVFWIRNFGTEIYFITFSDLNPVRVDAFVGVSANLQIQLNLMQQTLGLWS